MPQFLCRLKADSPLAVYIMAFRRIKGRVRRGERPERNREIAQMYDTGNYSQEELGKKFHISKSRVSAIVCQERKRGENI
jgi:hypothetical protein